MTVVPDNQSATVVVAVVMVCGITHYNIVIIIISSSSSNSMNNNNLRYIILLCTYILYAERHATKLLRSNNRPNTPMVLIRIQAVGGQAYRLYIIYGRYMYMLFIFRSYFRFTPPPTPHSSYTIRLYKTRR